MFAAEISREKWRNRIGRFKGRVSKQLKGAVGIKLLLLGLYNSKQVWYDAENIEVRWRGWSRSAEYLGIHVCKRY